MRRLGPPARNLHTKQVRRRRSISSAKKRLASWDKVVSRYYPPSSSSKMGASGSSIPPTIASYVSCEAFCVVLSFPLCFLCFLRCYCAFSGWGRDRGLWVWEYLDNNCHRAPAPAQLDSARVPHCAPAPAPARHVLLLSLPQSLRVLSFFYQCYERHIVS